MTLLSVSSSSLLFCFVEGESWVITQYCCSVVLPSAAAKARLLPSDVLSTSHSLLVVYFNTVVESELDDDEEAGEENFSLSSLFSGDDVIIVDGRSTLTSVGVTL